MDFSEARRASSDMSGGAPRAMAASARRRMRSGVKSSRRKSRPSGWNWAGSSSGFDSSSDNPGLAFSPVTIPDQPLVELTGRVTRQLRVEIDRARTLYRRKLFPAKRDEFRRE